jgi:glycosyltransferase involved in cell wall biosynthesis
LREHRLEVGQQVAHEGHVSEARLWDLVAGSDICVNLRYPTMGETSGMVLRALSLGRPVVVNDVGWFSELPDAVAAKLQVGEREAEVLAAFLSRLADDESLRERMARAARAYVQREHAVDLVAELYAAALEEAAAGAAVRDSVLHEIASAAQAVGFSPSDEEIVALGARARELGLG